jgi:gluconolactonase
MTLLVVALAAIPGSGEQSDSLTAPGATVTEVGKGFDFTEGPAVDAAGNVFFSDVPASRTYRWNAADGKITLVRKHTDGGNGLYFDAQENLLMCQGGAGRVVAFDPQGKLTVVADRYDGKRFNQPNDLWIDPKGGVYFTDPIYGNVPQRQDGQHVYYVTPDRKRVLRVIDDMVRPNGLIGPRDGKILYVSDHGAGKTYRYRINDDRTLSDKTLFCNVGSDGMTIDSRGNVYLTTRSVEVFNPAGKKIADIKTPHSPANVVFAGKDRKTLFITARQWVYTLAMNAAGG